MPGSGSKTRRSRVPAGESPCIVAEIPYGDPLPAFSRFAGLDGAVFLDSAITSSAAGRFSFIAADPFLVLRSRQGVVSLGNETFAADPFEVLATVLDRYAVEPLPALPPFQTGVAGYFGYDLAHHLERLPRPSIDDQEYPDLILGLYDTSIAFDHELRRAWIVSNGFPETTPESRARRARSRLAEVESRLAGQDRESAHGASSTGVVTPDLDRATFIAMVERAIEYIRAGDIYQANLSQRFRADLPAGFDLYRLYLTLRALSPAPFAAYLNFGNTLIASASPERFLKLRDGSVETRPIKGTRPRGSTPGEDARLAHALLSSEKDRAENLMIVDLLRNDLSRVCADHSVDVSQLCGLESYATVHHLVSIVTGSLRPGLGPIDLLRAAFPGGSVTGAPKIRAMEIIAELEPSTRGSYCGSVGYIGFEGSMDTSISIRTYTVRKGLLTFQVGSGIVADSDPEAEFDESMNKAEALLAALKVCER